MKILITGGAGYIGATIASACLDAGHSAIVLDDLSTGRASHVEGRTAYVGDVADGELVDRVFAEHPDIFAVVHCAARIVVPESMGDPLGYYSANVGDTVTLLRHLRRNGAQRIVFSSSASIYAAEDAGGVAEDGAIRPGSPYARTKLMVEQILEDAAAAGEFRALSLRYFNPIGVDPHRRTGPTSDNPTHVLGLMMKAADAGTDFSITGVDWPTRDGSGLRDFIHVWDLAQAHVRAVERFDAVVTIEQPFLALNIGTGRGTTVRELIAAFRAVSGQPLRTIEAPRRAGDSAGAFAMVDAARSRLDWSADRSLEDGIRSALEWRASHV